MKVRLLLLLCLVASWGGAVAQNDPMMTQYWALPTAYNPAAAGSTEYLRITGAARMQWVGITNAPKSFMLVADSPLPLLGDQLGAGLMVQHEQLGLFRNTSIAVQGVWKFRLGPGNFAVGVQAGWFGQHFKGTEAELPDVGPDEVESDGDGGYNSASALGDMAGGAFDLSAGIFWSTGSFYAGAAVAHLLEPSINLILDGAAQGSLAGYQTQIARAGYFMAGGNIALKGTLFEVQPSCLLRTDFHDFTGEATLRASWRRFLSVGVGYRWNDAVSAMLGVAFSGFYVGYAYDVPLSDVAKASSGSHEIVAGYRLKLDFNKKNNHKHRSIRLM